VYWFRLKTLSSQRSSGVLLRLAIASPFLSDTHGSVKKTLKSGRVCSTRLETWIKESDSRASFVSLDFEMKRRNVLRLSRYVKEHVCKLSTTARQNPKGDELYCRRLNLGEISVEGRTGVDVQITRSKNV